MAIFKGFKQTTATTGYEVGYIYFVRPAENTEGTDGYIVFNGKQYGTGVDVEAALRNFIGELPEGETDVISYVEGLISDKNVDASGDTYISASASDNTVTVGATSALTDAIDNANSALQSISILGSTIDSGNTTLSVDDAKTALGLGSAAYEDTDAFDAAGAAEAVQGDTDSTVKDLEDRIDDLGDTYATDAEVEAAIESETARTEAAYVKLTDYGTYTGTTVPGLLDEKADKVENATSGNFAGLDGDGNLTDSGFDSSDFDEAGAAASAQTAAIAAASAYTDEQIAAETARTEAAYAKLSDYNTFTGATNETLANKANTATTLAGYGITDAYTKTEIDGKVAGLWHFKGVESDVESLPSGATAGDVYQVGNSEYAWNGEEWVELGSVVDLSAYKVKDVDTTASEGVQLGLDANGNVTVSATGAKSAWEAAANAAYSAATANTASAIESETARTEGAYAKLNDYNTYTGTTMPGLLDEKADKVSGATNGNFAGLDANGNLTDSGSKASDFDAAGAAAAVQGETDSTVKDLEDRIDSIEDAIGDLGDTYATDDELSAAISAETARTEAAYVKLTDYGTYTGTTVPGLLDEKADKVSGATAGHFAGLDGDGNLTDSGFDSSDFDEAGAAASAQTAAEAYADSLASNYATAAQGATADSAVQEVNGKTGNTVTIDARDIAVGSDVDGAGNLDSASTVNEVLSDLYTKLASNNTTVSGSTTINVSAVENNVQTVSAKISETSGNIITDDNGNGLFAAIYYDGDDVA